MSATTEMGPMAPQVGIELYTGQDYFIHLADELAQSGAGDRIGITTLSLEPKEPLIADALDELCGAADRGAEVYMGVDAFAQMFYSGGNRVGIWPNPAVPLVNRRTIQRRQQALEKLASFPGAHAAFVNQPQPGAGNPFGGRSHLKTAVINDRLYLGGPNWHEAERFDIMAGLTHVDAANRIYDMTKQIVLQGNTRSVLGSQDREWYIDDSTRILVDAGAPRQSGILNAACAVIDEAQGIVLLSGQYAPDRPITAHLRQAIDRDIQVIAVHNHPRNHLLVSKLWQGMAAWRRHYLPPELFANRPSPDTPMIHTHALATETVGMVTSHNLISTGVRFGTTEIALIRQDHTFATRLGKLITQPLIEL